MCAYAFESRNILFAEGLNSMCALKHKCAPNEPRGKKARAAQERLFNLSPSGKKCAQNAKELLFALPSGALCVFARPLSLTYRERIEWR
jgi:hypothetical protein